MKDKQMDNLVEGDSLHSKEGIEKELERLKKENVEWKNECERLAKVGEHWQNEYYKLAGPNFVRPKLDNL